jgi:O-acetyl-ADP-ribose deacetylase (regulator of RNase III)
MSHSHCPVHMHDTPYPGVPAWRSDEYEDVSEALHDLEDLLSGALQPIHLNFSAPYPQGVSLPHYFHRVMARVLVSTHRHDVHVYLPGKKSYSHCVRCFPAHLKPRHVAQMQRVELVLTVGDLAHARGQVLVNASNRQLKLGGGVSGSLKARFGERLQSLMREQAICELHDGELVVTTHPVSSGVEAIYHVASAAGDPSTIRAAVVNILDTAIAQSHTHLIMPALGCGTGGMEVAEFARILLEQISLCDASLTLEVWCWTLDDYDSMFGCAEAWR